MFPYCILSLILLISFYTISFSTSSVSSTLYKVTPNTNFQCSTYLKQPIRSMANTRSKCLIACHQWESCQTIVFRPNQGVCLLFNQTISQGVTQSDSTSELINMVDSSSSIADDLICNPVCQNNGICVGQNECKCLFGFFGSVCEIRKLFLFHQMLQWKMLC